MASPIPQEKLERGLMVALGLGVIESFEALEGVRGSPVRRFVITFADQSVKVWTPAAVEAFGLGCSLTLESKRGYARTAV